MKAVFFDIDGTLVDKNSKYISQQMQQLILDLRKKEIKVAICTGRHVEEIRRNQMLRDTEFDGCIYMNGQICLENEKMIYQNPINRDDIVSLINYLEEKDITCVFAELNKMYINKQTNRAIEAMKACNAFVPPVESMEQALKNPIYQVVPFITLEEETTIMQYMPNCQMTRWCDKAVDINPRHGGKGRGIAKMLSYWNIKKEDVMAFGDGENDIDMLEKVGIGVAMQNAEEAVKHAADEVANAPDYEGIKNMLRKYKVL